LGIIVVYSYVRTLEFGRRSVVLWKWLC
jgi:hypothetical protein